MSFSEDFNILREQLFELCGFKYSKLEKEDESSEYQACRFKINNKSVLYRRAKITPTKIGQFVTIWKRIGKKPIQPYDRSDDIDLFVVTVKTKIYFGQFIFPKAILVKQGVLSIKGVGGKRALRVYPPWDKAKSKQAKKTQYWQLDFFTDLSKNKPINVQKLKLLYSL